METPSLDLIRQASYLTWRLRGEPVEFDDLFDEMTDEDLARLWLIADEWRLSVNRLCDLIGQRWVEAWRARGRRGLEVDGFLMTTKKGSTTEKCVDSDGFWDWMAGQSDEMVRKLFNENSARKGSLPEAARTTFFKKEQTEKPDAVRQVSAIPVEVLEGKQ